MTTNNPLKYLQSFESTQLLSQVISHIDFSEPRFYDAIWLTIFNIAIGIVMPQLEYHFKLTTKIAGGNPDRGNDGLAYLFITIDTFRRIAFIDAVFNSKKLDFGGNYIVFNYLLMFLGIYVGIYGFVLFFKAFCRLGMKGAFYGDHFGFLFDQGKLTEYPFSKFTNPMTTGNCLMYLGSALFARSMSGLFVGGLMFLTYELYYYMYEVPMLKIVYGKRN